MSWRVEPRPRTTGKQRSDGSSVVWLGQDTFALAASIADLHPKNDTFPGEVYLRLGAEVLTDTVTAHAGPIDYEGLRQGHLGEVDFRGKENRKIQYAVLSSAAIAGGPEPDLLDEVSWWGTDDFWRYGLLAAVALIRACADQRDITVAEIATELAERHNLPLQPPLANG